MTPDRRHRYLAFSWPMASGSAGAQAAAWSAVLSGAPHWRAALRRPGLEVWTGAGGRTTVRQVDPRWPVVIGDYIARRRAPGRRPDGEPGSSAGAARRLLEGGWGAYVALFVEADGGLNVLNDPSGSLPAYSWRLRGVEAVSDDVLHLPSGFAPAEFALDWNALTQILQRPYLSAHLSPLAGYAAVTPGALRSVGTGRIEQVWRPADKVTEGGLQNADSEIAAAELRSAVLEAVDGLAALEPRLLVEVSGGLDSSIVAAALAITGHGQRIAAAVNSHAPAAEGDERAWARALCDMHGLPLVCAPMRAESLSVGDYEALAAHIAPAFAALDAPRDQDLATLAREAGATALFGGQGGDAVFFQMPTTAVVADYLAHVGPAGAVHAFPRDVARRLRRSLWSVLAEARARRAWVGVAPASSRQFWGRRLRESTTVDWHPWLRGLDGVPPGKQVQIAALLGTHEHWNRSRRSQAVTVVQPLLAQPVVEAALGIPTWRLLRGGRDRALARSAFADLLPDIVATRRSKGMVAAVYARRMAASLETLRPYLLDGVLVEAELLDRSAIEAALRPDALLWNGDGARLGRALMMEAWVRRWQGRAPDLATGSRFRC